MLRFSLVTVALLAGSAPAWADPFEKPRHAFRVWLDGRALDEPNYFAALVFPNGHLLQLSFPYLPPEAQAAQRRLAPMLPDDCEALWAVGAGRSGSRGSARPASSKSTGPRR